MYNIVQPPQRLLPDLELFKAAHINVEKCWTVQYNIHVSVNKSTIVRLFTFNWHESQNSQKLNVTCFFGVLIWNKFAYVGNYNTKTIIYLKLNMKYGEIIKKKHGHKNKYVVHYFPANW